jgi:predicted DNA-binding antitoxin AbrB/MazE fold protein
LKRKVDLQEGRRRIVEKKKKREEGQDLRPGN